MSSREVSVGVKGIKTSPQINLFFLFYKKTGEILRLIDSYVGGFKDPQVSGLERKNHTVQRKTLKTFRKLQKCCSRPL